MDGLDRLEENMRIAIRWSGYCRAVSLAVVGALLPGQQRANHREAHGAAISTPPNRDSHVLLQPVQTVHCTRDGPRPPPATNLQPFWEFGESTTERPALAVCAPDGVAW